MMKYLNKYLEKSPIEKMNLMVKISKSIVAEIENYYELPNDNIPTIDKSKLVIDADQLLMILIYVLAQSGSSMVPLYAHINQIYEFSTD
jgi:hypothetical protein